MTTAAGHRSQSAAAFGRVALTVILAFLLSTVTVASSTARAVETGGKPRANSADRVILWTACHHVALMTDADLDRWKALGVDGFVCSAQRVAGLGGGNRFTDEAERPGDEGYTLQSTIAGSKIVERAASRGMKIYLGIYLVNQFNTSTPLVEWFDDAGWNEDAIPAIRGVAAAARSLGFAGLAFDQEMYQQANGVSTATWEWDYPGNTRSEAEVREAARSRGAQMMEAIVGAFPNAEIVAYATYLPETWDELVQLEVNDVEGAFSSWVLIDFWDGLTSVEGYKSVLFLNATFYKTAHIGPWEAAFAYQYNHLYAMLSRRLSNWKYASSRVSESPFVWVSDGTTRFEVARSPEHVAEQLAAVKKWGMGRTFGLYGYGDPDSFDYGPYEQSMRASSKPAVVDNARPELEVSQPSGSAAKTVDLTGTALDDLAVRIVRWRTDTGRTGVAKMTWVAAPGNPLSGLRGQMEWEAEGVPVGDGARSVLVTVEDIKGLTRTREVTITR